MIDCNIVGWLTTRSDFGNLGTLRLLPPPPTSSFSMAFVLNLDALIVSWEEKDEVDWVGDEIGEGV